MAEDTMPATEVAVAEVENELTHYELAFHILPTVADEEVAGVQDALKAIITKLDGSIDTEETAQRFDLAYPITKAIEGKNQTFATSHLGWVRFMLEAEQIEGLKEELDQKTELLRYMIAKLTKEEAENPFRMHEIKPMMPETVGDDEDAPQIEKKNEEEDTEEEVQEEELDESLDKITQ